VFLYRVDVQHVRCRPPIGALLQKPLAEDDQKRNERRSPVKDNCSHYQEGNLKQFVLMNRKTGDLMIGYRVTFMDVEREYIFSTPIPDTFPTRFGVLEHHGWVIEHPIFEVPWFMNLKSDTLLENLGEL